MDFEDVKARWVELKERATELYREVALLASVTEAIGSVSTGASLFVTSKREIETWAGVGQAWGTDINAAIEPESRLDVKFWQAILDCPNPDEAREIAHHEQLGPTQIRRRFGVVRQPVGKPPAYRGTAKVERVGAGMATFQLDLAEGEPELRAGDDVMLTVKRRQ
jgi:hypothetical protein